MHNVGKNVEYSQSTFQSLWNHKCSEAISHLTWVYRRHELEQRKRIPFMWTCCSSYMGLWFESQPSSLKKYKKSDKKNWKRRFFGPFFASMIASYFIVSNYSLASIKFVKICKVCCWSSFLEKKVLLCIEDAYHSLCKRMCHGIIAPFSVIRNFHSSLLLTTHQEKWWKIHFPTFIYFRTIVW